MSARVLRTFGALAVVATAILVGIFPAAGPASALDTKGLGITPLGEADNFHVALMPGEATDRQAVVSNRTDQSRHILIYPVDATNTSQGGFALGDRGAASDGVGVWARIPMSDLVLRPHSTTNVPLHLAVPASAAPGDRAGGIVIQTDPDGQPHDVGNGMAVQMNLIERIGVRIYLHVAGQAVRTLAVGKLTSEKSGGDIHFRLPITNTGNVRLAPLGDLHFHGFGLPSGTIQMSRVETLLPGSTVMLTARWQHPGLVANGSAIATVNFEGGVARTSSHIRLIPLVPTIAVLAAMAAMVLGFWKIARFLARARSALRTVGTQIPRQRGRHGGRRTIGRHGLE